MKTRTPPPRDEGLEQIDDLERRIVLAKEQSWTWNGASAEEIALFLPAVKAQARAVCDRLREEYLARSRRS